MRPANTKGLLAGTVRLHEVLFPAGARAPAGTRFRLATSRNPRQREPVNFFPNLPVLETERLRLRPFTPADVADLQRLAGDKAVADTTLSIPHPYPDGVAEAWIASHAAKWDAQAELVLAITLRSSGELMGSISMIFQIAFNLAQLGYWIGVPYWNQGYTTEAARAVIDHGFQMLGLDRIEAHHMAQNPASGRVLAKAGMRREGFSAQALRKNGVLRDVVFYGIDRADWPGLR